MKTNKNQGNQGDIRRKRTQNNNVENNFDLLNFVSDSIIIFNSEGVLLAANKAMGDFTGVPVDQLIGKRLVDMEFFDNQTRDLVKKQLKRMPGEAIKNIEVSLKINDEIRYFEAKFNNIDYFGQSAGLITLHDVTTGKRLQEILNSLDDKCLHLKENEEHLRSIYDSSPNAITLFNLDGTVVDCNKATLALHGYSSKQEIIGKKAFQLISKKDYQRVASIMKKLPKLGLVENLEFTFLTKEGSEFPAEGSASIIKDALGGTKGFLAITRNMSEHKKIEHSLEQKLKFEKIISSVSSRFVSCSDFDSAVNSSLKDIGNFCGADRNYIFLFDETNQTMSNTYEWCAEGVSPQKNILQKLPMSIFPWTMKRLQGGKNINVEDVSKLPQEASAEREILEKQGIKSLIILPLYISNKLGGFVGFDNVESVGYWSPKNIGVLRIFSEIVGVAIGNKQSTDEVHRTQERFENISSNISEWIWEVDTEGRYTYSNNSVENILGYKPLEIYGKHFYDFFLPEERELLKKDAFDLFASRKNFKGFVNRNLHKNGSIVYMETNGVPIFDADKQFVGYRGADYDITERKKVEEALQISEEKHRKLFEESMDAIFLTDANTGIILDCNAAASELVNRPKSELIGHHQSILHPQTLMKNGFTNGFKEHVKDPKQMLETQVVTPTGEIKHVSIKARVFEFQGRKLMQGTFRDITGRKRMQQALVENEEKFRGIANSVRDAIVLLDGEAKVTYWNPAAEKIFGYASEEAIGKKVHDIVVPDSMCKEGKERIAEGVKIFAETGMGYFTVGSIELVGRRKNNREFPAKLSISPIKLSGKWHAVGVVKDITNRKIAEQKLSEAEQRYHTLFNQSPLGVLVIDPQTTAFIEFNDVAHQQLGYTREEFEKITICDIEAKETPNDVRTHTDEMLEKGGGEFETIHRTKNGDVRNVLVTTRTIELTGKKYIHAIFHDITEIRNVQNSLIESETRYRQLVELAQEGIWALDNNLKTVFVNPRMTEMLGYTQSEMIGKSVFEFVRKNEVAEAKVFLKQFKEGIKGQFEYTFQRKDGTCISTAIAASPIKDDEGQQIGTLAVIADITERTQLEDDLRASEERFRTISTSANDAILLIDEKDIVLYWNPAAEQIFGFSEKEAIGNKLSRMVTPEHGQKRHAAIISEFAQNPSFKKRFEFMAIKKDQKIVPIEVSLTTVKLKEKKCLLAVIRDISERKAMEDALKQERDMLENMAANIGAGVTIIDRNYRIIWANQLLKEINGSDVENKLCSVYNKSNEICHDCGVRKVFENNVNVDRHDYHSTHNGRDEWVELIVTPIKDKDGKVVAALELAVNVTERKRLQQKLADYSQKLEEIVQKRTEQLKKTQEELVKSERLAAIGELAGMVGHDLRNPLTGIKNSAYFLRKKGDQISKDYANEMLDTIERCVEHSNQIINDLLEYSREIRLKRKELSPRMLLLESLTMVSVPENIKILNCLPHKPLINVDSDKIERVFINLVKNALDAMPSGGKLIVCAKQARGNLEISFADTGVGIDDELLTRLFSPLVTTKAKGMGFGLAICKRIVEAHGGTISVLTAKGKGATFTVSLPIGQELKAGGEKVWINVPESSLLMTTKKFEKQ